METKTGTQTSEFKLAQYVIFAGIALDVLGITLEALKQVGLSFGWMPVVMVIVGSLMTLVSALGYTRSRTMVKLSGQTPTTALEVAALLPLLKEVVGEVKAARRLSPETLPPQPPSL
jgi:hypothetical protein